MTSRTNRTEIVIEAVPHGRMSSRETAVLLYGALDALCGLLNPPQTAGGRRVLEAAAKSLWPESPPAEGAAEGVEP